MTQASKSAGRPRLYEDTTLLCLHTETAKGKLQKNSDRRAIINKIIDNGGRMTIGEVCEAFDYDVTNGIKYLVGIGWLKIMGE